MVTVSDLRLLADSQRTRCLGCGEAMSVQGGGWQPHGSCRSYYGAGERVDYPLWLGMVERVSNDGAIFDRWNEGEPMHGIPSVFAGDMRTATVRYEGSHGNGCECGRCVPSLAELTTYPRVAAS